MRTNLVSSWKEEEVSKSLYKSMPTISSEVIVKSARKSLNVNTKGHYTMKLVEYVST